MTTKRKLWYRVVEDGGDERYEKTWGYTFSISGAMTIAGDDAAEDYFYSHDGWEAKWPLTFALYESEDGPELGRCEVDMETVPTFHAVELNTEKP